MDQIDGLDRNGSTNWIRMDHTQFLAILSGVAGAMLPCCHGIFCGRVFLILQLDGDDGKFADRWSLGTLEGGTVKHSAAQWKILCCS